MADAEITNAGLNLVFEIRRLSSAREHLSRDPPKAASATASLSPAISALRRRRPLANRNGQNIDRSRISETVRSSQESRHEHYYGWPGNSTRSSSITKTIDRDLLSS